MFLRYWFYIISIISMLAICSALVAEYFFDLYPCYMCLKQRHPYYFIILIFFLFYFFKKLKIIWFFILSKIAILYGLFYSIWHIGIEQKILKGPEKCSSNISQIDSISNLKEKIMNTPVTSCEDIIWHIFGLSAATINTLILILILIFNTIYLFKFYEAKER